MAAANAMMIAAIAGHGIFRFGSGGESLFAVMERSSGIDGGVSGGTGSIWALAAFPEFCPGT